MGTTIRPKEKNNSKSNFKWGSSLAWAPLSPFSFSSCFALLSSCSALLFALLLSFSPCCSPLLVVASLLHRIVALSFMSFYYSLLHPVALLFVILVSFSRHIVVLLFTLRYCSPLRPIAFFYVLHYCSPLRHALLLSSSPYYFPLRVTLLLSFSCHNATLLFASCYYSPLHTTLLFSSSCCTTIILFALLLSFSSCCFPLCALLLSFAPYYSPLRALLLSSSPYCSPLQLFFYFKYKVFRVASIMGVLLFIEKSCTTPSHSFLQELGVIGS